MTIDDILHILAPLTPAVLPVIVLVWYRTRQELHGIREELRGVRGELAALRQPPLLPDSRLDALTAAVERLGLDVERVAEAERYTARMLGTRQPSEQPAQLATRAAP